MKVVSSKQMAHIESLAYRDGASENDFMEEAGSGVALVIHDFIEKHNLDRHVILVCGKGNNGGDAYVAGVHLLHLDYDVFAFQLVPINECSHLCKENHQRFLNEGGRVKEATSTVEMPLPPSGVIVDGIFGTGFKGDVKEPFASIIHLINNANLPIISVDIPSGLNGETGAAEGSVIVATETAFLGLPKTGFFLKNGWDHVGKLRYVDFGLPQEYIDESEADLIMSSADMLKSYLPKIRRSRHKYEAGLVVGLAGSPGMPGAAIMSATSALHGGAGIVRLLHPEEMQNEFVSSPWELIKIGYNPANIDEIAAQMNKAAATFIGPGIGRKPETLELLKNLLPKLLKPCVIDADALTLLAGTSIPFPENTVLTPHKGEMDRLLGRTDKSETDMSYLKICQDFAETRRVTLVLKGGPSFILQPDEQIIVNPTGDPGMATAGSGDILTGLVAALLAQGLTPQHAAALGVFIHGLAGEHAAQELTSYCMTATDILYRFPEGFSLLEI